MTPAVGNALKVAATLAKQMQDWLERVHEWGNLTDQRYPDFETEQSELRLALQPS